MPADIVHGNRKFGNIFNAKRAFLLIIMAIADTLLIPNTKKSGMQVARQGACLEMGKLQMKTFSHSNCARVSRSRRSAARE